MRVGVMGAGITGTCVALELADAGHEVDLYDREAQSLSRASYNNEGKIHLGFVYGQDATGRTAETMIRGALRFRSLLTRWMEPEVFDNAISTPFLYAVPDDSMLSPDEVRRHFHRVSEIYEACSRGLKNPYFQPIDSRLWWEIGAREFNTIFDRRRVLCAFRTEERAVDPRRICSSLRDALDASPRLFQRCLTEVVSVARSNEGRIQVRSRNGGKMLIESYDTVVNALWEERLAVDATMGLHTSRPVMHRYKVGLRTSDARISAGLPSVTFMLGMYGDTVAYPGHAFVSWYPAGLLRQELLLHPSRPEVEIGPVDRSRIITRQLTGLRQLMPGISSLLDDPLSAAWEITGGYITAWGKSGIDDRGSELHQRYAVGVASHGNYHTIDTGKFTMAPFFAAEACARILKKEPS